MSASVKPVKPSAVADEPAPPGRPGQAEELDEIAELGAELRSRRAPESVADLAWQEGYPYPSRLSRPKYERTKRKLQIELLKLQAHVKDSGTRLVVLYEGRDAAGKGGAIKRYTEHLNPRGARVVALSVPSEQERSQ